jgi:hypothetical protein
MALFYPFQFYVADGVTFPASLQEESLPTFEYRSRFRPVSSARPEHPKSIRIQQPLNPEME